MTVILLKLYVLFYLFIYFLVFQTEHLYLKIYIITISATLIIPFSILKQPNFFLIYFY